MHKLDPPICSQVGRPRESFVVIHSGSDDGTANVGTAMPEVSTKVKS